MNLRQLNLIASTSLIALIILNLAWELWLAPLRPGGSILVLKAVLLLWPLRGILNGRRYTFQWSTMFILLFFGEGIMRAWSDLDPLSRGLACGEIALSTIFFLAATYYAKYSAPSRLNAAPEAPEENATR